MHLWFPLLWAYFILYYFFICRGTWEHQKFEGGGGDMRRRALPLAKSVMLRTVQQLYRERNLYLEGYSGWHFVLKWNTPHLPTRSKSSVTRNWYDLSMSLFSWRPIFNRWGLYVKSLLTFKLSRLFSQTWSETRSALYKTERILTGDVFRLSKWLQRNKIFRFRKSAESRWET